jgi:tetratricopeptide (TPR) repeat protein
MRELFIVLFLLVSITCSFCQSIDDDYYELTLAMDKAYKSKNMTLAWSYMSRMLDIESSYINNIDRYPILLTTKFREIIDRIENRKGHDSFVLYLAILYYRLQQYEAAEYCFIKAEQDDIELSEFRSDIKTIVSIIQHTDDTKPIILNDYPLISDGLVYLYYPESYQKVSKDIVQVWTYAEYYKSDRTYYYVSKNLYQFNLTSKHLCLIDAVYYDLKGNARQRKKAKEEWEHIIPDTIGESLFTFFSTLNKTSINK